MSSVVSCIEILTEKRTGGMKVSGYANSSSVI